MATLQLEMVRAEGGLLGTCYIEDDRFARHRPVYHHQKPASAGRTD